MTHDLRNPASDKRSGAKLSIIVPVFNNLKLLQTCLESLSKTVPASLSHEVILIDDGSTDGARDFVASQTDLPFRPLLNERNLGFAVTNNRAAFAACGEILCMLNSDTILLPGWIEPLLKAFHQDPKTGVVGNIQRNAASGEIDHAGIGFHANGYPIHYRDQLNTVSQAEFTRFDSVTAACWLTPKSLFLRHGGFCEDYVNGFEDIDYCLRLRQNGRTAWVANRSVIRHHIAASEGRLDHERTNADLFLSRWQSATRRLQIHWEQRWHAEQNKEQARRYLRSLLTGATRFRRYRFTKAWSAFLAPAFSEY